MSDLVVGTPFKTKAAFADDVGVTTRTVDGWIERGYVQTLKIGKIRMINMAAEFAKAMKLAEHAA